MERGDPQRVPARLVALGGELFNGGAFFEAHEPWEEAWHALNASGRREEAAWLHGLILVTAGLENLKRGKPAGFRRQVAEGLHRLRAHRGLGEGLGLADEDAFIEALVAFYIDACRRKRLERLDDVATPPPKLLPSVPSRPTGEKR